MFDENPGDVFWEFVPRAYMEEVFRCLIDSHRVASYRPFDEFEAPEASNMQYLWRRQLIEGGLRNCAREFPQVIAEAKRDVTVTWWYHTLVKCGRVEFTENSAPNPDHIIRPSIFRERYAAHNPQMWLPGLEPDNLPNDDDDERPMYGILLHGRDPEALGSLGFAVIRFPTPDLKHYNPSYIDLFQEFPDVAVEIGNHPHMDIEDEQIDDLPDIDLHEGEDVG